MNVRIQGHTIFSLIALNFNLLKDIFEEVRRNDDQIVTNNSIQSEMNICQMKLIFMHILYPNF